VFFYRVSERERSSHYNQETAMANGSENSGGRVLVLGPNGKTGSRSRNPKKFSDYVERTVASGVWGAN
jgi:hypothetical protein